MKDANRKSEPKRLSQIDGCLADKKITKKTHIQAMEN